MGRCRRVALTQAWFSGRRHAMPAAPAWPVGTAGSSLQIVDLIPHAVALALDEDRLGVVQEPVEQRRRQGAVVVEDLGPVLERPVRGDDGARLAVSRGVVPPPPDPDGQLPPRRGS